MSVIPIPELNDRARDVFRLVVESYLGTGLPVGSRTISKMASLSLSPASIRNVMQDLEELGLLAAPHTSAGRMPTETGLRLFVDGMMQAAEPSVEERRAIEAGIAESGPIEEALSAATATLSGLSACAGIVMVPKREPVLRQFGFVPLNARQALAVLVGQDGSVENRVLDLPEGVSPVMLNEAANFMSARFAGLTLREAGEALSREMEAERGALDRAARGLVGRGLAPRSADAAGRPGGVGRGPGRRRA
ncbi:MAG: heat-inducible transcriptional repressor HrcA, partial [Pseudomonadota bacterium]|nr:heat-inducible transcriptional repressor HrcA [Pseudomonadota bacterium]